MAHDHFKSRDLLLQVALFFILFICLVYTFPRWADPNQNSRIDMVMAIVDDGTFMIDQYVENTVDYAKVGDHYYSDKAPGVSFLGVPLYAGLKELVDTTQVKNLTTRLAASETFKNTLRAEGSGVFEKKVHFALAQVALTFTLAALPTAVLGVLMYRLLGKMIPQKEPRIVVVLAYCLLTPVFAYAGAYYGHQLSALLLFGAFYLVFVPDQPIPPWRLLVVGFLLSYSVITEYPAALGAITIGIYTVYTLYKRKQRLWGVAWLLPGIILIGSGWMLYNQTVFGGPLELGYSYSELWSSTHSTGFLSLTQPRPEIMWEITFGLFRGLFIISPWLLLAFPGYVIWWKSFRYRAEWLVSLSIALLYFLFNASSSMWWGGFSIGPRYFLPALPFLAMSVPFVLVSMFRNKLGIAVSIALLALSFVPTWGLTLAGQAFPPDTINNPLMDYAWINWKVGNIARNIGTLMGLRGPWSLLPLIATILLIILGYWMLVRLRTDHLLSTELTKIYPSTENVDD
ncbi:MAG: hypothetical protein ACERKY_02305 [Anaerolineales bacterium]